MSRKAECENLETLCNTAAIVNVVLPARILAILSSQPGHLYFVCFWSYCWAHKCFDNFAISHLASVGFPVIETTLTPHQTSRRFDS